MWQITTLNLRTLGWKVENKYFVHIFADRTKVKIPSEINWSLHISKKYLVKTQKLLEFCSNPLWQYKSKMLAWLCNIHKWAWSIFQPKSEKNHQNDLVYLFENSEMVSCYQDCSDLLWEKNCSRDQEKDLTIFWDHFIQTVKGQNNFW